MSRHACPERISASPTFGGESTWVQSWVPQRKAELDFSTLQKLAVNLLVSASWNRFTLALAIFSLPEYFLPPAEVLQAVGIFRTFGFLSA